MKKRCCKKKMHCLPNDLMFVANCQKMCCSLVFQTSYLNIKTTMPRWYEICTQGTSAQTWVTWCIQRVLLVKCLNKTSIITTLTCNHRVTRNIQFHTKSRLLSVSIMVHIQKVNLPNSEKKLGSQNSCNTSYPC